MYSYSYVYGEYSQTYRNTMGRRVRAKLRETNVVIEIYSMNYRFNILPYCFVRTGIGWVVAPSPRCDLAASHI